MGWSLGKARGGVTPLRAPGGRVDPRGPVDASRSPLIGVATTEDEDSETTEHTEHTERTPKKQRKILVWPFAFADYILFRLLSLFRVFRVFRGFTDFVSG